MIQTAKAMHQPDVSNKLKDSRDFHRRRVPRKSRQSQLHRHPAMTPSSQRAKRTFCPSHVPGTLSILLPSQHWRQPDAVNVNVAPKGLGVLFGIGWSRTSHGGRFLSARVLARPGHTYRAMGSTSAKAPARRERTEWQQRDDATGSKGPPTLTTNAPSRDHRQARNGIVQAYRRSIPCVPFGGETENGFRKFCAKHAADGLKCSSAGTGPAQVAVAIKTAIAALEGQVVPQSVKLPTAIVEDPNFKDGQDYFPEQSDNFFVGNAFPTAASIHGAGNPGSDEREPVVFSRDTGAVGDLPCALSISVMLNHDRESMSRDGGDACRSRLTYACGGRWTVRFHSLNGRVSSVTEAFTPSKRRSCPLHRAHSCLSAANGAGIHLHQDHVRGRSPGRRHRRWRPGGSRSRRHRPPTTPALSASSRNCRSSPTLASPILVIINPPTRFGLIDRANNAGSPKQRLPVPVRKHHPRRRSRICHCTPAARRDRQGAAASAAHPHSR